MDKHFMGLGTGREQTITWPHRSPDFTPLNSWL